MLPTAPLNWLIISDKLGVNKLSINEPGTNHVGMHMAPKYKMVASSNQYISINFTERSSVLAVGHHSSVHVLE